MFGLNFGRLYMSSIEVENSLCKALVIQEFPNTSAIGAANN